MSAQQPTLTTILENNGIDVTEQDFLEFLDRSFAAASSAVVALSDGERQALDRLTSDLPRRDDEPEHQQRLLHRLAIENATSAYSTTMSTAEAAERLGIDRTAVTRRIGHGKLHGVKMDGGKFRIPRWQFSDVTAGLLPGLSTIVPAIPARYPPGQLDAFLHLENEDCDGRTPLAYLTAGGDATVVARLIAELDQW